jgi:hypothetical protein
MQGQCLELPSTRDMRADAANQPVCAHLAGEQKSQQESETSLKVVEASESSVQVKPFGSTAGILLPAGTMFA